MYSHTSPRSDKDGGHNTQHKTVLITDATLGIGLQFVEFYENLEWKVIAAARTLGKADQLKTLAPYKIVQLDSSDKASILSAAEELEGEAINLLINNAGIFAVRGQRRGAVPRHARVYPASESCGYEEQLGARVAQITSFMGSVKLTFGEHSGFSAGGRYGYFTSKAALNMINASLAVDLKTEKIGTLALYLDFIEIDPTEHRGEVAAEESISGLMSVIVGFDIARSDAFYDWNGKAMPW